MKNRQNLIPFLIIAFSFLSIDYLYSQQKDANIKGQFNTDIYYQTGLPSNNYYTSSYNINLTYGIFKNFDCGVYYNNNFKKDRNEYETGVILRYYFTQLIINNPQKIYLYAKGLWGKQWVTTHHEYWDGLDEDINTELKNIGGMIGCRYMFWGRLGSVIEFGYQYQNNWTVNAGLTFSIKK